MRSPDWLRFTIADWAAWAPGIETREDWIGWLNGAENSGSHNTQASAGLPAMLRRRVSTIGQKAFQVCHALSGKPMARFVFCSRYGELDRTIRILRSLAAREPVSPSDFSLSVYNALPG